MAIDIAVVDSGVNPWHSHVQGVQGGFSLRLQPSGEVLEEEEFRDELGHGTAIAGIIREKAPAARLHVIKIFHQELRAPAEVLMAALERAMALRAKVIHLSLGTERRKDRARLDKLCREADASGSVIVASARGCDDRIYPAALETVIGVYWDRQCAEDALVYRAGKPVEFGAHGRPRPIPGVPQELNLSGSSFAAARVTAWAAQHLERNPNGGSGWVREVLQEQSKGG
ncbi:MAG: S8 family serine peptidase [bacterium]